MKLKGQNKANLSAKTDMENKIADWFKVESIYLVKKNTVPRAIALFVFMDRISVKFSCCYKASDQD